MAFQRNRKGSRDLKRICGLWRTKKTGLIVGTARDQYLDELIEVIESAQKKDLGVVFMVSRNTNESAGDRDPVSALLATVETPRDGDDRSAPRRDEEDRPARRVRKKIEEEPEGPGDDPDNDLPF